MKKMTTTDLQRQLDGNADFVLVNVLPREKFEKKRIPGSVSAPVDDRDFVDRVTRFVDGDKSRNVVVYCANTSCDASLKAIRRLEKEGFSNVFDHEAGMEAWESTGHAVEICAPAERPRSGR